MKHFTVMSRQNARKYTFGNIKFKTIIISITDVFSEDNSFCQNPNIIGICRVKFDDVEKGENNCITTQDARQILDFVEKHSSAEHILVHCEAGVSRSAGACAALMLILNGNDNLVFDNPRFCPNMTVYRTILNTYMENKKDFSLSEEEIATKEKNNITVWKNFNNI